MKYGYKILFVAALAAAFAPLPAQTPADLANVNIGGISHLLVPTFPTAHLPNGALRFYPDRCGLEQQQIRSFPLTYPAHRNRGAFKIAPFSGEAAAAPAGYNFDNEAAKPYEYRVYLDDFGAELSFAPTRNGGIFKMNFDGESPRGFFLCADNGELKAGAGGEITGFDVFGRRDERRGHYPVKIYIYARAEGRLAVDASNPKSLKFTLAKGGGEASISYALSYVGAEQAKANFDRQLAGKNFAQISRLAKEEWNRALSKIKIFGGADGERAMFYTSLYRCFERMADFSEDGKYFSGYDGKVHSEPSFRFHTDDWAWDTFRNLHPLMTILEPAAQLDKVRSYIAMGEQSGAMPTFPQIYGDMHAMNGSHYAAIIWDSHSKSIDAFDLAKAYALCKKTILERTMIPWRRAPKTELDDFYSERGYFPALKDGEPEPVKIVSPFERRQAVAVTLGQSYDDWCMWQMAKKLGYASDAEFFKKRAFNYRNLFNKRTGFFAPKDADGNWIEPFDPKFPAGVGGRSYYAENNAWTYIWDVLHNQRDLISLFGSPQAYEQKLDRLFVEPLGALRWKWASLMPDSTAMVGQFTMGNEPSLHIPYLYAYVGKPWKTQKLVRRLLSLWFRNDFMGMPGDEDGGAMSSFYVFSAMGFYPTTPGLPMYVIGSPRFDRVEINLENGKQFVIKTNNNSPAHKYIQSARLNGEPLNRAWIKHSEIMGGGVLEFDMGRKPNKNWASSPDALPPSFEMP